MMLQGTIAPTDPRMEYYVYFVLSCFDIDNHHDCGVILDNLIWPGIDLKHYIKSILILIP